jgi:hypothetical protein
MSAPTTLAANVQNPWIRNKVLLAPEILIVLATIIALLALLIPGPIHLMLFLTVGQVLIITGVALYLSVAITDFLRRRGVSQMHFASGETVFRQGDPGDFVYTIISGQVEVLKEDPEQGETVLTRLGPGQYFGEMALVSDTPRMATVRTLTPVDAMTMARADFTTLFNHLPDFRRIVEDVMKQRQADATVKG